VSARRELPKPLVEALDKFFWSPAPDSIGDLWAKRKTYQLLNQAGEYERQARKLGIGEQRLASLVEWVRAQKQAFESHVVEKLYCDPGFLRRLWKAAQLTEKEIDEVQIKKFSAKEIVAYRVYLWWESNAPFPTVSQFYDYLSRDITLDRQSFRLIVRQLRVASWFRRAQRGRPTKKH
jgi:hypothetical protein